MDFKSDILDTKFFNQDARLLASKLLGKVLFRKYDGLWLKAQIIETEAYLLEDKASHASLGFTEKRRALFMEPGTIYMYHSRAGDSLNVSCQGEGNAVLIKSAIVFPFYEASSPEITLMQSLNPLAGKTRQMERLCSGQSLLCKSLHLKIKDWDKKNFDESEFFIADLAYKPKRIIQTRRLGIPQGRDEHLLYRFLDADYAKYSSKALRKKDLIY